MKPASIALTLIFSSAQAVAGPLTKPPPTCETVQSYLAYEIAVAIKGRCDPTGVKMKIPDVHRWFNKTLTEDEISPETCRTSCAKLRSTEGMGLAQCVKQVHVAPFVQGMMNNGAYNATTCNDMKSRL